MKVIKKEAKIIAGKLDLQNKNRVLFTFIHIHLITLNDPKPNFVGNLKCHLINPAKCKSKKFSMVDLDKINNIKRSSKEVNQWQNTSTTWIDFGVWWIWISEEFSSMTSSVLILK